MIRIVVDPSRLETGMLELEHSESHYLGRVRRVEVGDAVAVLDGHGHLFSAVLKTPNTLALGDRTDLPQAVGTAVELAFVLPKGRRMDTLLEKATEIGATAFHPLVSTRSVRKSNQTKTRWERVVRAAARQCEAPWIPSILEPKALDEFLVTASADLCVIASPSAKAPLREILPDNKPDRCIVLTGPEGGFDPHELQSAMNAGWLAFHLGPQVLRAETAPLVVLSLLRHRYSDLG